MERKYTIYAVDFDGTLCESAYPGIGAPNMFLIEHLKKRRSQGNKIILWTCRCGEHLKAAVDWCRDLGLEFDAVNENIPEHLQMYDSESRKVFADVYIDDKAINKPKYHVPFMVPEGENHLMDISLFAQSLNGREYSCGMFTQEEIQTAFERGWVIVTGASDDLMEFEGAFSDEGGCFDGGKVYFSPKAVYNGEDDRSEFPNCIEAFWCNKEELDENGRVIPWTYKTTIPHETFMVYEYGEPYCRGIVFSIEDLK